MMSSASEEADTEQKSNESCDGPLCDDETMEVMDPKEQVYCNDLIMRKVVSYVSDLKDRRNLELASPLLRYWSSRVPYISADDNITLDMNFTAVEPIMTVTIAGNRINMEALTSNTRRTSSEILESQPELCILKTQQIIKRFGRQIRRLKIGGISDFERRLGYIPDHQLVLTRDFCDVLDPLNNVDSLILRNLCLMPAVIQYWGSDECALTRRVTTICFHSIWFDHAEDIDNFVSIVSGSVRHLQLSDCSGKTVLNIIGHLRNIGCKLDTMYLAVDYRTFRSVEQANQILTEVEEVANELHICACFTRFICQPGFRILVNVISSLSDFSHITSLEVDLGPARKNTRNYQRFFAGLPIMKRLRLLRLFGSPLNYSCMDLWKSMLQSLSQLSQIREFSMVSLLRNMRSEELKAFCESLPVNLNTFALHYAHHLQDGHFSIIAKRCPRLETLYLRDLRAVTSAGIANGLKEFGNLSKVSVSHSGPVTAETYELLGDREKMPNIKAAVLGGNRDQQSGSVLEAALRRLPQFRVVGTSNRWRDCEYHLWSSNQAYQELVSASYYADCPGCLKDVSLIEDDDDDIG